MSKLPTCAPTLGSFAGTAFMTPLPILGIQIWVSPIVSFGIASSASGTTAIPLPLPPDPLIAGVQFDAQTIWLATRR